jgi:hypothetical protein
LKRHHRDEIERLRSSYEWALHADVSPLLRLVESLAGRTTIFVGSGGALAVARFAADLHQHRAAAIAQSKTPLELLDAAPLAGPCGVVLLSARVSHPDVWLAVETALMRNFSPVVIITHRPLTEIKVPRAANGVGIVSLPTPVAKDGFLATNSILTMATLLLRSYNGASSKRLPDDLPSLTEGPERNRLKRQSVVLGLPGYAAISLDVEVRLSELGLSCVQMTDYRNLAHGRHTGLARALDETTVIPILAPPYTKLASATLRLLPKNTQISPLATKLAWPTGVLDLFIASMKLAASQAESLNIDAAHPGVPGFGRRLYHLSVRRYINVERHGPIERKLCAAGFPVDCQQRSIYAEGFREWQDLMGSAQFGGLVLDYDGTVNRTEERFDVPSRNVQTQIFAALEMGLIIGFASGRGRSLYRDLRDWIPRRWWDRICLGLYNGGALLTLSDKEPADLTVNVHLRELFSRLNSSPLRKFVEINLGPLQLEATAPAASGLNVGILRRWIAEVMMREPRLPLKVVTSAHSVDVIPLSSTKGAVVKRVADWSGCGVLVIGDQGQVDGNDFELLAHERTSLSVD